MRRERSTAANSTIPISVLQVRASVAYCQSVNYVCVTLCNHFFVFLYVFKVFQCYLKVFEQFSVRKSLMFCQELRFSTLCAVHCVCSFDLRKGGVSCWVHLQRLEVGKRFAALALGSWEIKGASVSNTKRASSNLFELRKWPCKAMSGRRDLVPCATSTRRSRDELLRWERALKRFGW